MPLPDGQALQAKHCRAQTAMSLHALTVPAGPCEVQGVSPISLATQASVACYVLPLARHFGLQNSWLQRVSPRLVDVKTGMKTANSWEITCKIPWLHPFAAGTTTRTARDASGGLPSVRLHSCALQAPKSRTQSLSTRGLNHTITITFTFFFHF